MRYPFWRAGQLIRRAWNPTSPRHLIFVIANHFEPSWREKGFWDLRTQQARVDQWCEMARAIGATIRDCDGTPFRHTSFYPAEQYHSSLIEKLAGLQHEGLGEVEIHLHHGVESPDSAINLRRTLENFRDLLAEEHRCLSRGEGIDTPMYAFVHGNLALANSARGKYCGVDSEMQILAETGCYADFTLPSAPDGSQVPRINAIYECGHPLGERSPHRSGPNLRVGHKPKLPVLFTGPLVFNWSRRVHGIPVPRLDDGVLAANYTSDINRLHRWANADITVRGKPEWVFIKLYCHGFFDSDQNAVIGESIRRFWDAVLEYGERTEEFKIHFASAREAFNIALAAVDGRLGEPGLYRNYKLLPIMEFRSNSAVTDDNMTILPRQEV
jgi:hypothetical protein